MGNAMATSENGLFNVYRFFNTATGAHFFTSNEAEKDFVIATMPQFRFEGNSFDSNAAEGALGSTPVYRLYNLATNVHFYTANKSEKDFLVSSGNFRDEGISYYAYTDGSATGSTPLYRFFNTATGTHFYTDNEAEKDGIIANNKAFNFEGIAYHVGGPSGGSKTINLTTNADTPSAVSPAANTLGTAGVDIYSGVFDATGGGTTISNIDILEGAGGTDALNIRVASVSGGGSTIAPVSTNVETFFITNQVGSGAAFTLNFANIQGET